MKDKLEAVEEETKKAGNPHAKAAVATPQEMELRKRIIEEMDDD